MANPIGLGPLIHPVQGSTAIGKNPMLYEKEAIIRWLTTDFNFALY